MSIKKPLYLVLECLRRVLANDPDIPENTIVIGPPNLAFRQIEGGADNTYISLFLYRTEHSGYPADATCADQVFLRTYVLITAFCSYELAVSGMNELEVMGSIIETLNKTPILKIEGEDKNTIAKLQIVPCNLSLDDMNHLWTTQGNVPYRLSVAYELSLLPIPIMPQEKLGPHVGEVVVRIGAQLESDHPTQEGIGRNLKDVPNRIHIDTNNKYWTPHICLVTDNHNLTYYGRVGAGKDSIKLIVLGKEDEKLDIQFEVYTRKNSIESEGEVEMVYERNKIIAKASTLYSGSSSEDIGRLISDVKLPNDTDRRQVLIRVTREYKKTILTSNPVLLTIELKE